MSGANDVPEPLKLAGRSEQLDPDRVQEIATAIQRLAEE